MVGNRVFGHSLILCVAAALFFAPWGVRRPESESKESLPSQPVDLRTNDVGLSKSLADVDPLAASTNSQASSEKSKLLDTVNGLEGHVALGQVHVGYWMITLCIMLGSIIATFNLLNWTRLSSVLTFACFGMAAACTLVAIIDFSLRGAVGAGCVLSMLCSLAGLALSPTDEPTAEPVIHQMDQERRQSRSAA